MKYFLEPRDMIMSGSLMRLEETKCRSMAHVHFFECVLCSRMCSVLFKKLFKILI